MAAFLRPALLPVLFALLASCSTPESRSREKAEAFSKLKPAERQKVLEGRVQNGMGADAVYIALGQPNRIEKDSPQAAVERWIFTRPQFYEIPRWRYSRVGQVNGREYAIPEYDPLVMKRDIDTLEVVLKNGRVVEVRPLEGR